VATDRRPVALTLHGTASPSCLSSNNGARCRASRRQDRCLGSGDRVLVVALTCQKAQRRRAPRRR
jgi:hypothetical protein